MMRVTIIYDNESCLVEAHEKRILFDTGTDGELLLSNMKVLGISPASIDELFLSHAHFDHIGGLSTFLKENERVRIYAPVTIRGIRPAGEVIYVEKPIKIDRHFYSTGLLGGIEQSLLIEDKVGLVVVVGCSHPGVGAILSKADEVGTPHTLIGGLHDYDEYQLLERLQLVCPTHCTRHIAEIRSRYPDKYTRGGVGEVIEI
jgi:7,8-dihydropterin-6-yl-methyl-4-(beta-D-ribofuranosyl)aminobenzene 5'-phosphate synthase